MSEKTKNIHRAMNELSSSQLVEFILMSTDSLEEYRIIAAAVLKNRLEE